MEIWKIRDSSFTEISGWLVLGQRFNYFEAVSQQSSLSHPISLEKRFCNLFYWIQIYWRFAVLKLNWLINEKTYLHKQDFTTASTLIAMTKRIASWPTKEVNFFILLCSILDFYSFTLCFHLKINYLLLVLNMFNSIGFKGLKHYFKVFWGSNFSFKEHKVDIYFGPVFRISLGLCCCTLSDFSWYYVLR